MISVFFSSIRNLQDMLYSTCLPIIYGHLSKRADIDALSQIRMRQAKKSPIFDQGKLKLAKCCSANKCSVNPIRWLLENASSVGYGSAWSTPAPADAESSKPSGDLCCRVEDALRQFNVSFLHR